MRLIKLITKGFAENGKDLNIEFQGDHLIQALSNTGETVEPHTLYSALSYGLFNEFNEKEVSPSSPCAKVDLTFEVDNKEYRIIRETNCLTCEKDGRVFHKISGKVELYEPECKSPLTEISRVNHRVYEMIGPDLKMQYEFSKQATISFHDLMADLNKERKQDQERIKRVLEHPKCPEEVKAAYEKLKSEGDRLMDAFKIINVYQEKSHLSRTTKSNYYDLNLRNNPAYTKEMDEANYQRMITTEKDLEDAEALGKTTVDELKEEGYPTERQDMFGDSRWIMEIMKEISYKKDKLLMDTLKILE